MDVATATESLARSTTLTSVGVIGYLIIGGFILSFVFETESWGWPVTFFAALLGSVIRLWLIKLVRRA